MMLTRDVVGPCTFVLFSTLTSSNAKTVPLAVTTYSLLIYDTLLTYSEYVKNICEIGKRMTLTSAFPLER